ncbi:MAG TPA: MFS transporter [Candidatus Angelobacter sp.]|jgi:NNP family nitrate/nitrite transporter-like MFS transporter|nr:MFS transporter [Candidatus Angelobacter sp.]
MRTQSAPSNTLQLILGTGAFALCFAVFGSVSAMMPVLKKQFHLAPMQASIAMAIPVLLGSLGRIPLGLLTDRFGGRKVFSFTMVLSVVAALMMGLVESYSQLLLFGFFTGIALASFSIGVAFVSGWYPANEQGFALGVYGAGNVGQSLAAFGAPLLFARVGFRNTFWSFAGLLAVWCLLFMVFANDAPRTVAPKSFAQMVQPLSEKMSWVLSFFYFLTFGGFVAMSIYLPMFLTEIFRLTPQDAGLRTAGFVLLATAMRPIGGWVSDKVGGLTILLWIFPFVAAMALLLTFESMVPFTMGALGMAAAIGLGNGAVFKLVPQYFPQSIGAVTGLVGAMGGLGGFFPPLALGLIRQQTGSFFWGFGLLTLFALLCLAVAKLVSQQQLKLHALKTT